MSALRKRGLQIDDPLGPGRSAAPTVSTGEPAADRSESAPTARAQDEATDRRSSTRAARKSRDPGPARSASRSAGVRRKQPDRGEQAVQPADRVWREWSGITSVGSFRLPHELLAELGDTARELGLPIGMLVTAAITQLLDRTAEQIAALVDKADDARIHGRRSARSRKTYPEGGG